MIMGSRKKSGKLIAIVIILIILVALLAGGIYAYLTTDLFKSEQTLFFKYMGKNIEKFDYVENTKMQDIAKKKEEKPYILKGNLQYVVGENINNSIHIGIDAVVDKSEDTAYAKANLDYQNQNLFSLEYANSNNIYALKSDEIITAFLGIENDNLKVLAQKLGISDTTAIPNTINQINLAYLLQISAEEKEHIKETYISTLINNIPQQNFKKEKDVMVNKKGINYLTTAYKLNLNAEELKQVKIVLLQTLKEDSITLNILTTKAKMLGLDEKYTQINNLTEEIQKQINTINNKNATSNEGLNIIVYTANQELIKTEITLNNEVKCTIYADTQENTTTKYILLEKLTEQTNKIEIQLNETRNEIETVNNILINLNNQIGIDLNITRTGTAADEKITTKYEININEQDKTSTILYEQEETFVEEISNIIELNRNNCGVLNDYTTEQLQTLLQAVGQRTVDVINSKLQTFIQSIANQAILNENSAREQFEEEMRQEGNSLNEIQ